MLVGKGKEMRIFNIIIRTKAKQDARELEAFKRGMSKMDKLLNEIKLRELTKLLTGLKIISR